MGLDAYNKKLIRAKTTLGFLKEDLGRVMTPNIREIILTQISQKEEQIQILLRKTIPDAATKAPTVEPLPKKEAPPPTKKHLTRAALA
jgi:hypothetical protein